MQAMAARENPYTRRACLGIMLLGFSGWSCHLKPPGVLARFMILGSITTRDDIHAYTELGNTLRHMSYGAFLHLVFVVSLSPQSFFRMLVALDDHQRQTFFVGNGKFMDTLC